MRKILITGANSYVGVNVENWLKKNSEEKYYIDTIDMVTDAWRKKDFSYYDVIFHVAGIAHADVGKVSEKQKQLYYKVNTDLAVEVATKARASGVGQFIFMSSMIIYSGCDETHISYNTVPKPLNFYGDSKWQADQKVRELGTEQFKVVVLRPPMIYGKESKGNYPELAKLANRLPFFPIVKNERSMIHIDNLCEFIRLLIDNEEAGIYFPQNAEYTVTTEMVRLISKAKGHKMLLVPGLDGLVKLMMKFPGKIGKLAKKAFGSFVYDMKMSEYKTNYRINSLEKSIELTEDNRR